MNNPDCPAYRHGDPAYADLNADGRMNSTFGPRLLHSGNDRYDFHRGLDISTPIGTPVFAITDGVVQHAGEHSSFDDPMIRVRHFQPGHNSCSNVGCYHAMYLHMSDWVAAADEVVVKGQLLGYTGVSFTDYEHLHFEIRDAPAFDAYSSWQRDAIHPLNVLPYDDNSPVGVTIASIDQSDPNNPIVEVTVDTARQDVVRVDVELRDVQGIPIPQPGDTPNSLGYNVEPSFFDMDA